MSNDPHIPPSNASLRTRIADKRSQGSALLRRLDTLRTLSRGLEFA
jgi:hypothetical protein